MPLKVFLDDVREAPDGWIRARTPAEVIALLETGKVEEVSLDHDLGLVEGEREATGYDVLLWIERQVATAGFTPPLMRVHSANTAAHDRMLAAIAAIDRLAGTEIG